MPSALRALANRLILYAADGLRRGRSVCLAWMHHRLSTIESDLEALIWAVGCFWATRIERFIRRSPPQLNGTLLLLGMYLTLTCLLAHLTWYGMPRAEPGAPESVRSFVKFLIYFTAVLLAGLSTPGRRRRRVFAAVSFPFLGLLGLAAVCLARGIADAITWEPPAGPLLRGPIFGLIVAGALSLPAVLIYRRAAAPIAALALIPAIAKALSGAAGSLPNPGADEILLGHLWPLACCLIMVAVFTTVLHRWLTRPTLLAHR